MADKKQLLKELNEASFAVNDIMLYLDTHPTDQQALQYFDTYMAKRKQVLEQFEQNYYPMTVDCITSNNSKTDEEITKFPGEPHWTWSDGPIPWEGGEL